MSFTQTQTASKVGYYKPTLIDEKKKKADFLLKQVNPNYIVWQSGSGEIVTTKQLEKLKSQFIWETDF